MATSEARILANRANSQRSTGPKTAEGKDRSRRNGLKHGMAGQGVVVPEADQAEVKVRNEALQKELAPQSVMGAILVGQMATLSVRMERGAKQEFASVAARVRHASEEFDAERVGRAEQLLKAIGEDPRGTRRKLLKTPEGVDVLVEAWRDLRADLAREPWPIWDLPHAVKMTALLGLREVDLRASRLRALSKATWGNFASLAVEDGAGLAADARQTWARTRLLEQIDEEIADLEEHYETLDFETIEQDRAEAGARAQFDPSKEAGLARRYESEARRGFFRAFKEFRNVEAEVVDQPAFAPPPASPAQGQPDAPLASCRDGASHDSEEPVEVVAEASWPVSREAFSKANVILGRAGQPSTTTRPIPVPA